jgi:hypothetical protein
MPLQRTYLIASHDGKAVKIGKSADPRNRARELQTGHPLRLKIVLVLDMDVEKQLHARFAKDRLVGEWFQLSDSIREFIEEQKGQKQSFRLWLLDQRKREVADDIGLLAFKAAADPELLRGGNKLGRMLRCFDGQPRWRQAVKSAHAEWRGARSRPARPYTGYKLPHIVAVLAQRRDLSQIRRIQYLRSKSA